MDSVFLLVNLVHGLQFSSQALSQGLFTVTLSQIIVQCSISLGRFSFAHGEVILCSHRFSLHMSSYICVFDLVLNILISGLEKLESLNLSFTTGVMDSGLRMIATITSLTSLNLDSRQITDAGLASLTSLTNLKTLDLFGARITDYGTTCLRRGSSSLLNDSSSQLMLLFSLCLDQVC
jgi:hypothetical protein